MESLFSNSSTGTVRSDRIIYTPSAFARSSLLHLQETGTLEALRPHKSGRSGLNSCLFFTVLSGCGRLVYGGSVHNLQPGDCVFIDCRRPYSHETGGIEEPETAIAGNAARLKGAALGNAAGEREISALWCLQWCHFYGPNMNAVYQKYQERGGMPAFHPADASGYRTVLTELYRIADSADYVRDMRIQEKLSSLLILLMEDAWDTQIGASGAALAVSPNASPGASPDASPAEGLTASAETSTPAPAMNVSMSVQQVKEYLDANYMEKITLDELSARFFINKYYLLTLFKNRYGLTVNAYLNQMRVTYVKQQLRFTDRTAESLAAELHIEPAYLSRLFKKVEGVSPSEFRRSWKGI